MQLWISGEIHSDVSDAYREARTEVEEAINAGLGSWDPGIRQWQFIAIMLPPGLDGKYPEVHRYRRHDRTAEFRLRIELEAFKRADPTKRCALICEALLRSLELATKLEVPGFDVRGLRQRFISLASSHRWLDAAV